MIYWGWLMNWSWMVYWFVDWSWGVDWCWFVNWRWVINWSGFVDWSSMITTLHKSRLIWNSMVIIRYVSNISGVMIRGVFYVLEPSIREKNAIMTINSISV